MPQDITDLCAPAGPDAGVIFDLAPLALLILSPAWRITRASARFLAEWHVPAGDCIGHELLPFVEQQLRPTRPAYLAHLTACIDDALAARAPRTSKPINTLYGVSWKARVIPVFNRDELLSIVLEWHEGAQNVAEAETEEPGLTTDEAFRILVQAVKDYAIFLLDTKGYIATWNTGAQLLKGYQRDEIIGKHFSIFYGQEDIDVGKPHMELELCMRDGRVEDEGWRYRKDGSRFWANVIITSVYRDGEHAGFGKVTRDLTERKSVESRLIAAYEESEKLKSDFLANMSHEIRTPMHGMLSACTLLLDTPLSARQRDMVNIMDESGQVLLQVINDILDYSKLSSGSFSIHSDIVGITSIVTSVVRSVQPSLPPSVHFELFLSPDLPRSVQGDPLRYRQVLQNIVGNAAKFTDKGTIRIRASVQSEDDDAYTVLSEVTDTGIGVPDTATACLFTPFMQFDATTTKQYQGTGLGLSIAKSLTEMMGGRIGYRPNPERQGSIFWFTVRFKKIKTVGRMQDWNKVAAVREAKASIEGRPSPGGGESDVAEMQELRMVSSTKNLLVVEDNLINQKVVLGMLRSLGFKNVALASNGTEAVQMVRGKPAAYDMVLMDINMPVMDGHEATKEIRAAGILVPVVAMTAYALKGDQERCLEQGMNDYIPKPVDRKRLIRVLGKWLLRMTDYRKTFEERMAELRRHQEALGHPTPSLESDNPLESPTSAASSVRPPPEVSGTAEASGTRHQVPQEARPAASAELHSPLRSAAFEESQSTEPSDGAVDSSAGERQPTPSSVDSDAASVGDANTVSVSKEAPSQRNLAVGSEKLSPETAADDTSKPIPIWNPGGHEQGSTTNITNEQHGTARRAHPPVQGAGPVDGKDLYLAHRLKPKPAPRSWDTDPAPSVEHAGAAQSPSSAENDPGTLPGHPDNPGTTITEPAGEDSALASVNAQA